MAGEFHIGDRVEVVDDTTRGVVVGIAGEMITVAGNDGFRLQYRKSELLLLSGQERIDVTPAEAAKARLAEENMVSRRPPAQKRKERYAPKMEVDLHIGQLAPTTRGMTKHDMLTLQLETAKRQLEFAIRNRIQKVVFIHGVGEGILKEELKYLFGRYPVKYYDADYQKYGSGATEVYIFQNP